jgi:hypothetical protein
VRRFEDIIFSLISPIGKLTDKIKVFMMVIMMIERDGADCDDTDDGYHVV